MVNKEFPTDFTTKSNPVDADLLIIADTEDANEMKKITIGSMTADIADGIVVDGSASDTTTYSSNKIVDLNNTQNTTITNNYNTLNTNKLNVAGQLRTGNGAWKVTYNNGSGNETEVTLGSSGQTLVSNGPTSAPTFQNVTADVNGQTEDTTGDMDADFALVYDASVTENRKQKMNVYRASQAESTTGTATNKFVPPAHLPKYLCGSFAQNANVSTTTTIAHGFGRVPKLFRITGLGLSTVNSHGAYDGTNNRSVFTWFDTNGSSTGTNKDNTAAIWISYASSSGSGLTKYIKGVVTWDSTNVTITWTAGGGGNSSLDINYIYEIIS